MKLIKTITIKQLLILLVGLLLSIFGLTLIFIKCTLIRSALGLNQSYQTDKTTVEDYGINDSRQYGAATTTYITDNNTGKNTSYSIITADRTKTTKICQIIGNTDWQTKKSTTNLTGTKYGVDSTDMGKSFVFKDKLYFLFGDTDTKDSTKLTARKNQYQDADDAIGYTSLNTINNQECLNLEFVSETISGNAIFRPAQVNGGGVNHGGFQVPMTGFEYSGEMYVFFSALRKENDWNSTYEKVFANQEPYFGAGRSVLAKKNNNGTFDYLYDLSEYKQLGELTYPNTWPAFINVRTLIVDSSTVPNLPEKGKGVLIFGTGFHRFSQLYLAYIPLNSLEKRKAAGQTGRYTPTNVYYFAGLDNNSKPIWKNDWENHNKNAKPIATSGNDVIYDNNTGFFYLFISTLEAGQTYNYPTDNYHEKEIIQFSYGKLPWQFSNPQTIFRPSDAYGKFIHKSGSNDGLKSPAAALISHTREDETGGAYAPSPIPQKFKFNAQTGEEDIYFLISTHNPYTVILMKSTLKIK